MEGAKFTINNLVPAINLLLKLFANVAVLTLSDKN